MAPLRRTKLVAANGADLVFAGRVAQPCVFYESVQSIVVTTEGKLVNGLPDGGVPEAVAVFTTWPASTSFCVSV